MVHLATDPESTAEQELLRHSSRHLAGRGTAGTPQDGAHNDVWGKWGAIAGGIGGDLRVCAYVCVHERSQAGQMVHTWVHAVEQKGCGGLTFDNGLHVALGRVDVV